MLERRRHALDLAGCQTETRGLFPPTLDGSPNCAAPDRAEPPPVWNIGFQLLLVMDGQAARRYTIIDHSVMPAAISNRTKPIS